MIYKKKTKYLFADYLLFYYILQNIYIEKPMYIAF